MELKKVDHFKYLGNAFIGTPVLFLALMLTSYNMDSSFFFAIAMLYGVISGTYCLTAWVVQMVKAHRHNDQLKFEVLAGWVRA